MHTCKVYRLTYFLKMTPTFHMGTAYRWKTRGFEGAPVDNCLFFFSKMLVSTEGVGYLLHDFG